MTDYTPMSAVAVVVIMRNDKTGEVSTLTLNEPTDCYMETEDFHKEDDDLGRMWDSLKGPSDHKLVLSATIDSRTPIYNKRVSEEMMVGQSQVMGGSWVSVLNVTHTRLCELVEKVAKAAKVYRGG